jgi:hypothetical protein
MSKLTETKRAYDKVAGLLDQELLKRGSNANELRRFREALDVAFYLLGWAQFEYLVRQEAEDRIEVNARAKTVDGIAWQYLLANSKGVPLRKRLDMIFHANQKTRASLDKDYELRNDAAHNYKMLPGEARDISEWLKKLEDLVDLF